MALGITEQQELAASAQGFNIAENQQPEQVDLSEVVVGEQLWQPHYGAYRREAMLAKFDFIADELKKRGIDPEEVNADLAASQQYVNESFDLYEGKRKSDFSASFAFIVPSRLSRQTDDYGEEINPYLPIISRLDKVTRQLACVGICPVVLETYMPEPETGEKGVMIFSPVFADIENDVQGLSNKINTIRNSVDDAVFLAHDRLGAEIVGLGATLPKYTDMGRSIKIPGVYTTTGHGGTAWLTAEMVDKDSFGIIGVGGMGRSTTDLLLSDDSNKDVMFFDTNPTQLEKTNSYLVDRYDSRRVIKAKSMGEVLLNTDCIIAMVTSPIHLEGELVDIDLSGKKIFDDSQPGSFSKEEVEARGGSLFWVIGEDKSPSGILTKESGFDYGGWGPADARREIWGCEAEVGSIGHNRAFDKSIKGRVSPEQAREIGRLCREVGIAPARAQSFGEYV